MHRSRHALLGEARRLFLAFGAGESGSSATHLEKTVGVVPIGRRRGADCRHGNCIGHVFIHFYIN